MKFLKIIISWSWPFLIIWYIFIFSCNDDKVEATCNDEKQNGAETGIDCGGPCDPCLVRYYDVVFPEYESMRESIEDKLVNITYDHNTFISGNKEDLTLDFFEPAGDTETDRPLIIMLGGTMMAFSPWNWQLYELYDYASYFASRGYALAFVNTRWWDLGTGTPQDFIDEEGMLDTNAKMRADVLSTIRFFRKNAVLYKIDTENIWLMGFSGGGMISLYTAYLDEDDLTESTEEFEAAFKNNGGIEGDGGNKGFDSSVKGVISLAGFMYSVDFVDEGDPPSYNLRGINDPGHPLECSVLDFPWTDPTYFCGAKAIGSIFPNEFYEITGPPADGMATVDPDQCPECDERILEFIYDRLGY